MAALESEVVEDQEGRGLRRFLVSSLVVHALGVALVVGILMRLPAHVERPLRVQIVNAAPSPPSAPAAPAAPPVPGALPARPDTVPELVETPKPRVEEAPRSKRFTGLYDRRGGPGAQDAPDSSTWRKSAPRVEGGSLRGEEAVRPPAVPPREAPPAKAPPAKTTPQAPPSPAQETKVARADPIPPGRTSIVQQPPPAAAPGPPAAPQAAPGVTAPPSGAAPGSAPAQRPSRSLRDKVAGLRPDYRPPVDDPGTAGDPGGRGDPGLETFRFKYATWGLSVKRDIERAWKVPDYGITSLSIVRFVVLPDGKIRDLQLEKSSGLASLDEAATKAISGAAPFRPFPPRMREENPAGIDITVNFYYREGRGILQWE